MTIAEKLNNYLDHDIIAKPALAIGLTATLPLLLLGAAAKLIDKLAGTNSYRSIVYNIIAPLAYAFLISPVAC